MKYLFFFALLALSLSSLAQVGVGTPTPNSKSVLDVNSTTKGFLPPRMDSAQRNAIVSPPAGLTIYNTTSKGFECYNGTRWYGTVHFIGENYGGGIVFFVYDNGQHGLIAATGDQSSIKWNNGVIRYTGAQGDGLNAGDMNTALIVATQISDNQTGNFAAKVCADYSVAIGNITYGDWYLPSKYELNLMYLQKTVVGGFANFVYWSSSEQEGFLAWAQNFGDGFQNSEIKGSTIALVRAVRAF